MLRASANPQMQEMGLVVVCGVSVSENLVFNV